ncbi:multidrug/biocide efflux PACE transporter [Pseudomonas sp. dw_358]|uniref:multidrug/biocide efflux PACE transporter n=1 Tax=Pseudomonas sp. dw_358 TaxID=2720083 RepID=UPI001BD20D41|nr:multidrug/biocide efflux PACE transporter [Pseudomonas sp. dw_358]
MSKSTVERVFQAACFEGLAILLCTPLFAWITGKAFWDMGAVTAANCVLALGWNVLFNMGFDRLKSRYGWRQGTALRLLHALAFEGGLIMVGVPLIAWWLSLSLIEALLLDLGVLLFFLPYTYLFFWSYDTLRPRLIARYGRDSLVTHR